MASKTTRLPRFFLAWRVYGVYGLSCQAILCYKVYSGVASRYVGGGGGGGGGGGNGCKDVHQDGASGPLT